MSLSTVKLYRFDYLFIFSDIKLIFKFYGRRQNMAC